MTRDQAKRAAILANALDEMPSLKKKLRKPGPIEGGYTHNWLEVSFYQSTHDPYDGGSGGPRLYVDLKTGKKIEKAARKIIKRELRKLGVTP